MGSKKHHRNIHPSRERRESFGDLIQIDGSPDFWFEDRADKCNLTVFIDDATSKITSLFFFSNGIISGLFSGVKKSLEVLWKTKSFV